MGITVMPGLTSMESDTRTQRISTTIGQARLNGRFYRHPDSALVSYPVAVDNALGALPDRAYNIAIVGGGAAGIASLYELSRLAKTLSAGTMTVTLYESDPDSFLTRLEAGTQAINVRGLKAGRVSAARVNQNDTVYEVGAMRFPEIAGLTWHYASVVYGDGAPIKVFPNPGKVPTEFMSVTASTATAAVRPRIGWTGNRRRARCFSWSRAGSPARPTAKRPSHSFRSAAAIRCRSRSC